MSSIEHQPIKLQYRQYSIDPDLPVLAFSANNLPSNPLFALNDGKDIRYMHLHNCIEIACTYAPGGELYVDGKKYLLEKNDVVIVMPYCAHILREQHAGPYCDYFYFDPFIFLRSFCPEALPAMAIFDSKNAPACSLIHGENAVIIKNRVCEIINELRSGQQNHRLCTKGLLLALTIELSRILGLENPLERRSNSMSSILPAVQYINHHFQENVSMEYLQNLCHMSGTHFRRLFKNVMGCSPLSYIQNLRINRACDLLLSSDNSILEISMNVGFDSISSFNRQFIKIIGTTPSKWRRDRIQSYQESAALSEE